MRTELAGVLPPPHSPSIQIHPPLTPPLTLPSPPLPSSHLQGQFDAECGVASNDAWISTLEWPGHAGFHDAPRLKLMVSHEGLRVSHEGGLREGLMRG